MSLTDLDTYYIKCISSLHSTEHLTNREPSILQLNLEEAIKNKTGLTKDFTSLISCLNNRPLEEVRTVVHTIEEIKTASSSDNELELDLFNEDLMCVICNGMDVAAGNRLLECSDCHSLYHQECHRPPVTSVDVEVTWMCQNCLDVASSKKTSPSHIPAAVPSIINTKSVAKSPPQVQRTSTSSVPNYKSSPPKTTPMSKPSKAISKANSSSVKNSIIPNINIISADKRLQIMKKKAAKLHEKRKQMPR